MKVTCPHMGQYTKLITELGKDLGWEIIEPPPTTELTIELGAKYMNELMCLPAKVTLGNMIQACELGAEKVIMFDSCGLCRLKTYWILQQRVLRKLGYNVTVYPVRLSKGTPRDLQAIDPSLSYWRAWKLFISTLRKVYKVDKQMWTEIMDESELVKIGIVGEIYSMLDSAVNRNLFKKIEKMGALAHNSLPLSYFIFKGLYNRGWMKRDGIDRDIFLKARKLAHQYFPKEIGGHGNESIIHTIYYAMKGFDGVIHTLPFPCMPESTVAPVLDDIGHEYSIPVMRIIFDTQTAEAGLNTRLEAFVDILGMRKAKRSCEAMEAVVNPLK